MTDLRDTAQRNRIAERTDLSMLVEASAGTGKTTAMVERLVSLVTTPRPGAESPLALPEVAAVTFTIKAAQELKDRVRTKLHERLRNGDESRSGTIAQAIGDLEQAAIGTIHSFCSRILREFPVEAGVDLRFRVMEEAESADLRDRVWDAWIRDRLDERDAPPELPKLLALGCRVPHLRSFAYALLRHRAQPVREMLLAESPPGIDWQEELAEIDSIVQRFEEADPDLIELCDLKRKPNASTLNTMREWRDTLADAVRCESFDRVVLSDALVDSNSKAYTAFREMRARHRIAVSAPYVAFLADWLSGEDGFLPAYAAAKRTAGVLDFDDLLICARDLVRDHPDVRRSLQQQYRAIIVDEFQDTDPVQADLILALCGEPGDETAVAPGRLCVVGDPKQSIYRFRGADIESYNRVAALIGDSDTAQLSTNFRSHHDLIDAVNAVFRRDGVFARANASASYEPAYSALEPFDGLPVPNDERGPRICWLDDGVREEKIDPARRHEAPMVAAYIRRMIDEGWPVRASGAVAFRPMRYGDVAILYRTANHLEPLEQALRLANVPYCMSTGKNFYQREEVVRLVSILAAVEQPADLLSVIAALRSPFFGVPDEDLADIALTDRGGFDYCSDPAENTPPAIRRAFEILRELHEMRRTSRPSSIIQRLYEATGVLAAYAAVPGGEQAIANLMKVMNEARLLERDGGTSFRRFRDHLRSLRDEGVAEGEAEYEASEDEGRVHLLSVHAAKGLEFPAVFVVDLAARPPGSTGRDSAELYAIRDSAGRHGAAMSLKGGDSRIVSERIEELRAADADRERAEHVRLLYVALTRARDYLALPRPKDAESGSWLEIVEGAPESQHWATEAPVPSSAPSMETLDTGDTPEALRAERQALIAERNEVLCRARMPSIQYGRPSLHETERGSVFTDEPSLSTRESRNAEIARRIGTAVHGALERLTPDDPEDTVSRVVRDMVDDAHFAGSEEYYDTVRKQVVRGLASGVVRRAFAAPRQWREVPVILAEPGDADAPPKITRGICDLVFERDGDLVLVDYKTDSIGASDSEAVRQYALEHYRTQLRQYVNSLEIATEMKVREAWLLFLRVDGPEHAVEMRSNLG